MDAASYPILATALATVLLAARAADAIARRWRVPAGLLLLAGGFAASEALVVAGVDTGPRWYHLHPLVFHVLIPLVVYETATRLEAGALRAQWRVVATLAGPALVLGVAVTACLLYLGVGHPVGFPLGAALLGAAILAAVDPGGTIEVSARGDDPAAVALEGESLLSDLAAVVLFAVFLDSALMRPGGQAGWAVAALFLWSAVAGAATGAMAGLLVRRLPGAAPGFPGSLLRIAVAFGAYAVCQQLLAASGAVAVLLVALLAPPGERAGARLVPEIAGWTARSVLFALAGATFTTFMFHEQWLAMLIAIGAVTASRFLVTPAALAALDRVPGAGARVGFRKSVWMSACGARGVIVLALSLPLEIESWYTLQSMAYGVVLFTLATFPLAARFASGTR